MSTYISIRHRAFFGDSAASRRGTCDFAFFCKPAFSAWLVVRPFFLSASVSRDLGLGPLSCRLPCRATCGSAFILSASVSRGLWPGLFSVCFRVAWLVARPLFCRLPCRVARGPAFMSLGCCHRWCHRLRYRRPRRALYLRSRPMDLQSHSYPANRPEIATP